jgi:hypothetical protein
VGDRSPPSPSLEPRSGAQVRSGPAHRDGWSALESGTVLGYLPPLGSIKTGRRAVSSPAVKLNEMSALFPSARVLGC